MKDVRALKGFESSLYKVQADISVLRSDIDNKKKEYDTLVQIREKLKQQIKSLQGNTKLKVSEHAMLRYIERVKGINIEEVEREILTDEVSRLVDTLGGNGEYPLGEHSLVMKNYTIITVK